MESELHKFRRKKELEQKKQVLQSNVQRYWNSFVDGICNAILPSQSPEDTDTKDPLLDNDIRDSSEETNNPPPDKRLDYIFLGLLLIAWTLSWVAFVKIGFGAVYFTISLLLFVYFNTKTEKRQKGEVSAYSVFNKDCQAIDGTLKPEHLEKQLTYRN